MSGKVGSVEMWFWGKKDHGCCRRKGTLVVEKGEREREEYTGE